MLNLDCSVHEVDGVTLVEAVIESSAPTARQVRIESTLSGPIWPPRRNGVPELGWDDDGFEGIVEEGERLALGFASPAPPVEPPVFVVDHERADEPPADSKQQTTLDVSIPDHSPEGIVRVLGSPKPPRDVVPTLTVDAHSDVRPPDSPVPTAVAAWLETVEQQVEQAEGLADARGVNAAARELERVASLDGAERLVETLERNERSLRAVANQATYLADRCAEADVPLPTLRRLA